MTAPNSPIRLRSRNAARLLPIPLLLVTLYYFVAFESKAIPGYWDGVMASSTIFLVFAAPFAAVAAAADANRLRRSAIDWNVAVRSPLAIIWDTCKFPVLFAFCVQLYAFGLASVSSIGIGGVSSPLLMLAWLSIIALHATVGYLIGRLLPMAAALPVSIVVSFVPMTFAWSSSIIPLRYFAGLALSQCCDVGAQLRGDALLTTITFSVIATVAFVVAAPGRGRRLRNHTVRLISAVSLLAVASISGFALSGSLGAFPAEARTPKDLHCKGTAPTICLYPAQTWHADPRPAIRSALAALEARGLPIPATVNGNPGLADDGSIGMVYRPSMASADLDYALASAYVDADRRESCYEQANVDAWYDSANLAREVIVAVIEPEGTASTSSDPRVQDIVNLPGIEFQHSVTALLLSARDCELVTMDGEP